MNNYRCPVHPSTPLRFVLKGGVGYCDVCRLYTRAAGVPEPEPTKSKTDHVKAKSGRKRDKPSAKPTATEPAEIKVENADKFERRAP